MYSKEAEEVSKEIEQNEAKNEGSVLKIENPEMGRPEIAKVEILIQNS